ncbi:MAG: galactokinase [Chloroflexi bacterium]|nr:galactokinase [Chloroflexota bacterium]
MVVATAETGLVRAPGRVNLIGEHTDYNDGFVLPAAIDLDLELRFQVRDDERVHVVSAQADPATYVEGVRRLIEPKRGISGEIRSRIPVDAGLSSSAALELAVARALAAANGQEWRPRDMAVLCQRAENEFVGTDCGIMDQLAVACGQGGHALLIDCRSLAIEPIRLPPDLAIVVCDSARPRRLVASTYNHHRASCEQAARKLCVQSLRDARLGDLKPLKGKQARYARHVVEENQRVVDFVQALKADDRPAMNELMARSHQSLRDLFEVSTPELNLLVNLANREQGCVGARMTGGGFGGCTINLVEAARAYAFATEVTLAYRRITGLLGAAYICRAANGVSLSGGSADS